MRIWIVATGEPWPTDEGHPRLLRGGILANYCAARGDTVTWWNSTFDHRRRVDRFGRGVVKQIDSGVTIRGLYASARYSRSVSVARIVNHSQVGNAFRKQVAGLERPDVILVCMPLVELAHEAVRYGRENGIPVVVDIRDLWPDVWLEPVPAFLHPLAKAVMVPWNRMLNRALRDCDAISGITDSFIDWGLRRAGRERRAADFSAPLAYDPQQIQPDELQAASAYWDDLDVPASGTFIACFFGILANRTGVELLVEAARLIPPERRDRIRIVIAGEGDAAAKLRERGRGLDHVIFPGWIDLPKITALQARASVGLISYPNTPDFVANVPNKVPEYLAGGLAVVSTLEGEVRAILEREGAGVHVEERTPEAIARALIALADNPARLVELKRGARAASQACASGTVYDRFRRNLLALARPAVLDAPDPDGAHGQPLRDASLSGRGHGTGRPALHRLNTTS